MWRSPVAHTAGGRVVAGSNPVIPTNYSINLYQKPVNRMIYRFLCFQGYQNKSFIPDKNVNKSDNKFKTVKVLTDLLKCHNQGQINVSL